MGDVVLDGRDNKLSINLESDGFHCGPNINIKSITVNSTSVIYFYDNYYDGPHLYVGSLSISNDSLLILEWGEWSFQFLDSPNLSDTMRRVVVRDPYDGGLWATKWQIDDSGYYTLSLDGRWQAPEPSTYGAVLGGLGLVVVAVRKRKGIRGG